MSSIAPNVIKFGPFHLHVRERRLYYGTDQIALGGRAMAVLTALAVQKGELVTRDEIFKAVWPGIFVHDSNLKVAVAALRRSLREHSSGREYIRTLSGRGYWLDDSDDFAKPLDTSTFKTEIPELSVVVGRDDDILRLKTTIAASRLVTVAGTGGLGKTTVAIAAALSYLDEFGGSLEFIDFSSISREEFVLPSVAMSLGINSSDQDRLANIVAILDRRKTLLVLDTCEHVLNAVAHLCGVILANAPNVRILATSRQILRERNEQVMWLAALSVPPADDAGTITGISKYSAPQLLLQRCEEKGGPAREDSEAFAIAEICRRLDGSPLALELISYPLSKMSADDLLIQLKDRLTDPVDNAAGTPERHHNLLATLDWSYSLLTETEARVLRAASMFSSEFDTDSVIRLATHDDLDAVSVMDAISGLRAKSMINVEHWNSSHRYRLVDTTRAFANSLLNEEELKLVSSKHALLTLDLLSRAAAATTTLSVKDWNNTYARGVDDLRNALNWTLVKRNDLLLGIKLVAAGLPLWYELSLSDEARDNCALALSALDSLIGMNAELELKLLVGLLKNMRTADIDSARAIFQRARALARALSDRISECQVLAAFASYQLMPGRGLADLEVLDDLQVVAAESQDRLAIWEHERLRADWEIINLRYADGMKRLEKLSSEVATVLESSRSRFDLDLRARTETNVGILRWMSTYRPLHGLKTAMEAAEHALEANHDWTYIYCQIDGLQFIFIECGQYDFARKHAKNLKEAIYRHGIANWLPIANCCIESIEAFDTGRDNSDALMDIFRELKTGTARHIYYCIMIRALMSTNRYDRAKEVIDYLFEVGPQRAVLSELLRYRAAIERFNGDNEAALETLTVSLKLATENQAVAWQLRSANDLARWLIDHKSISQARVILAPILSRFGEGFELPDLSEARRLMREIETLEKPIYDRGRYLPEEPKENEASVTD